MYATLTGNLVNVILNYLLIFGISFFPEMGVEGAAIGTIVSRLTMVVFILVYMYKDSRFQHFITSCQLNDTKENTLKK